MSSYDHNVILVSSKPPFLVYFGGEMRPFLFMGYCVLRALPMVCIYRDAMTSGILGHLLKSTQNVVVLYMYM